MPCLRNIESWNTSHSTAPYRRAAPLHRRPRPLGPHPQHRGPAQPHPRLPSPRLRYAVVIARPAGTSRRATKIERPNDKISGTNVAQIPTRSERPRSLTMSSLPYPPVPRSTSKPSLWPPPDLLPCLTLTEATPAAPTNWFDMVGVSIFRGMGCESRCPHPTAKNIEHQYLLTGLTSPSRTPKAASSPCW